MRAISAYLHAVGIATDRWINATVWGGSANQTVSQHAAYEMMDGKRTGCLVCWLLSVLVQKDHCWLTLDPDETEAPAASVRAAVLMILFFILAHFVIVWIT